MRIAPTIALALASLGVMPARAEEPVAATAASSLATGSSRIRQFAFDGDPASSFQSEGNPRADDHFTLTFDRPVGIRKVSVEASLVDGADRLDSGLLEGSDDGASFSELAKFSEGTATAEPGGRKLKAVRIRVLGDLAHPLVVREIAVESDEPIARFRYPVEFVVDVKDAPEMQSWADDVARLCERWYPRINDELQSDGFRPATRITMTMKKDYRGVAEAGGTRITGSVRFFKAHPDDKGAMIHETTHIVQRYRSRSNPGWLVEGVSDYFRFFIYEPGKAGKVDPDKAHYNDSYRTTAAFLDYVSRIHDKQLVLKLNRAMRAGTYKPELFHELTGKTLEELDDAWRASLKAE